MEHLGVCTTFPSPSVPRKSSKIDVHLENPRKIQVKYAALKKKTCLPKTEKSKCLTFTRRSHPYATDDILATPSVLQSRKTWGRGWMTKASGVGERRKGRGELRRDCHHRVAALFVPTRMQQWYIDIWDITMIYMGEGAGGGPFAWKITWCPWAAPPILAKARRLQLADASFRENLTHAILLWLDRCFYFENFQGI